MQDDYNDAPDVPEEEEGDAIDTAPEHAHDGLDQQDAEPEKAVVKITTPTLTKYERGTWTKRQA